MSFHPDLCRNESEVESKLIVSYLLPALGYNPDSWHQEVAFSSIRLDFLAFAIQAVPFVLDANSPLSVVMEAKSPKQNLDRHLRKFKRYLTKLQVKYGVLTNGKEMRIYERVGEDIQLVFQCLGQEVEAKIEEINALIGRESSNPKQTLDSPDTDSNPPQIRDESIPEPASETIPFSIPFPEELFPPTPSDPQPIVEQTSNTKRKSTLKVISVYHNKGGVGKTTTVTNLAAALRKKGKRILVIDLDSQANTTFALGLVKFDDEESDDIKDCNILQVLQSEEYYSISEVARSSAYNSPEVDVVPAHIDLMQYESELNQLDYSRLILVDKLNAVKNQYDIVLIDTPPALNLYARIALIASDYVLIPSDLKPFANQGLNNVKDFIKKVDGFRRQINKNPLEILGVLPCKISTNARFVQSTFEKRKQVIPSRYGFQVMESVIYDRDDLAKCAEKMQTVGNIQIADPMSVLDFKPDSMAAQEFEDLALEVLNRIGMN
ncbi:MAG: AAA family ATPase [Planktothrix sp.]